MPPVKKKKLTKREQNKADCSIQILKVSRRLFQKNGFNDTRMEDIAKKAKVSKATLYNYFPSKESLLVGTSNEILNQLELEDEKNIKEGKSAEERLFSTYKLLVYGSLQYPDIVRLIVFLNSYEGNALHDCLDPEIKLFRRIIEDMYNEKYGDQNLPDDFKKTYLESCINNFYGMYHALLFHTHLTYPEDTDAIAFQIFNSFKDLSGHMDYKVSKYLKK